MQRATWAVMAALCALPVVAAANAARAASVIVTVASGGAPLPGAVVTLEDPAGRPIAPPANASLAAVMDQRGQRFVPHILAVQVGTAVRFPNSDAIRHDVYSFSPAKTFDLPLYAGTPARPVRFDTPGVVILGCNIHDWMLAFIDVVPTPYFAQTGAAGSATLQDVPAGRYLLNIWAPRLKAPNHLLKQPLELAADSRLTRHFEVALEPVPPHIQHQPGADAAGVVQALERKFGRFRHAPPPA